MNNSVTGYQPFIIRAWTPVRHGQKPHQGLNSAQTLLGQTVFKAGILASPSFAGSPSRRMDAPVTWIEKPLWVPAKVQGGYSSGHCSGFTPDSLLAPGLGKPRANLRRRKISYSPANMQTHTVSVYKIQILIMSVLQNTVS